MKRLLLLVLSSCAVSNGWQLDQISSGGKFSSSKLSYQNKEAVSAPLFEIVKINNSTYVCFKVFSQKLRHPNIAIVIDNREYNFQGVLHEGGQKLALGASPTQLIIEALKNNKPVTIRLDSCEDTIDPNSFLEKYNKLQKSNLLQNLKNRLR